MLVLFIVLKLLLLDYGHFIFRLLTRVLCLSEVMRHLEVSVLFL